MIETSIQLGEPVEHRGMVIVPLFPRGDAEVEYLTLEDALPLGFRIEEIDEAGSVPELVALNPLNSPVLLYDGEELLGAKQNRILNVTVLAPAATTTHIPVSCVEQGRWHAQSAAFTSASHAAYPELRRRKAEQLSAEPLALGLAQAAVWENVAEKAGRHSVRSATGAAADIYRGRAEALAALRRAFPFTPGQSGALLALPGNRLCLDYLSRPTAFARLYTKLLDGYLLDGLESLDTEPTPSQRLDAFEAELAAAPRRRSPSAGLGDDLRLAAPTLVGSGLLVDDELVQLSAFTSDARGERTRVARPSRRR
jgi:hypothetical protein